MTSPKSVCQDTARANKRKNQGGLRQEIFILPNCFSRSVFVFARPKLPRAWNRLTSPVPVSHKGKQLPQNELQMANNTRFSWLQLLILENTCQIIQPSIPTYFILH